MFLLAGPCLLSAILPATLVAATPREAQALLVQIEADLRVIDNAQTLYGGQYASQLITDISRHVALPSQVDEWRATAQRARARLDTGQVDTAVTELEPLARTTGAARQRAYAIVRYWPLRVVHDRRIAQWHRFVAANRVQPSQGAAIDAAVRRLDAAVSEADFTLAGSTLIPAIATLLDEGFAEGRSQALAAPRDDRLERRRELPCPVPAAPVVPDPSGRARFDPDRSQPTDQFYPQRARREAREGRVAVEADVDATGCVTRAVALVSSGDHDIDLAALSWVLVGGAFRPATDADRPVAGSTRLWVKFELVDQ